MRLVLLRPPVVAGLACILCAANQPPWRSPAERKVITVAGKYKQEIRPKFKWSFQFSKLLTIFTEEWKFSFCGLRIQALVFAAGRPLSHFDPKLEYIDMRIIAFTDIHGSYEKVADILSKESRFDVIILGGDLTTNGTADEATSAIRRFQQFKKPLFAVAGNMDSPSFDAPFGRLGVNINARGVVLDDVGFFGIAGSPFTPMHTPYEISEEEIQRRAEAGWRDVQATRWKVFVPHPPPRDTKLDKIFLGKHVGSTAVREFVYRNQPDVLICGHIHEARGVDTLGNTKMVNCGAAGRGSYAVIEIQDEIMIDLRG